MQNHIEPEHLLLFGFDVHGDDLRCMGVIERLRYLYYIFRSNHNSVLLSARYRSYMNDIIPYIKYIAHMPAVLRRGYR